MRNGSGLFGILLLLGLLCCPSILMGDDRFGDGGPRVAAAAEAAENAEVAAKDAAKSAERAWITLLVVWLFSPLSLSLPLLAWWPAVVVFVLWDGACLAQNAARIFRPSKEKEDLDALAWFTGQLLLLLVGLSWFGVIDPVSLWSNHRDALLQVTMLHLGIGFVFAALIGVWDMYYLYYLPRKTELRERALEVREETVSSMAEKAKKTGEAFFADSDAVRDAVNKAWEKDSVRKCILDERLRVRDYVPRYVFLGLFWELYAVWRFALQYLVHWAELLANIGQIIANKLHKRLMAISPNDLGK